MALPHDRRGVVLLKRARLQLNTSALLTGRLGILARAEEERIIADMQARMDVVRFNILKNALELTHGDVMAAGELLEMQLMATAKHLRQQKLMPYAKQLQRAVRAARKAQKAADFEAHRKRRLRGTGRGPRKRKKAVPPVDSPLAT